MGEIVVGYQFGAMPPTASKNSPMRSILFGLFLDSLPMEAIVAKKVVDEPAPFRSRQKN